MYIHVRVYLLHAYMHGSRNFRKGGGRSEPQLVEKSPDNFLVLNLFYSGDPMFISEKLSFFQSPSGGGGGSKMSGSPTFSKVMGPICFFSIELVVFQGVRKPCSPSGFAHCLCARVLVCGLLESPKTKHAVSSSKAYAFRVIKKKCRQNYIYLFRSFWEVPLVTTKTTLR